MNWNGRTVVVTGGTSGIGNALVRLALAQGCRVLTCGRDAERLAALREQHPAVEAITADLGGPGGVDALVDAVEGWCERLDVLVNNAGFLLPHDLDGGGADGVGTEIHANLTAPVELSLRLLPLLYRSDAPAIVNLSSIVGVVPKGRAPVYSATKAGLRGYTRALRNALADRGVLVVDALPPLTDTPLAVAVPKPKRPPEEFAERILAAVAERRPHCSAGVNRVWTRLSDVVPATADRWIG